MLRDVYRDSSMSRTRVFEWHKRFVEGREDVEDDLKSGRPCTFTTDTNIEKVRQLVCSDCRLTIHVHCQQSWDGERNGPHHFG